MSENSEKQAQGGRNILLAEAVQKVMDERRWSLRGAQEYTGVNANTVDRMKKGFGVETENVIQFARAVSPKGEEFETVLKYLRLAGKDDIVSLIGVAQRLARNAPDEQTKEVEIRPGDKIRVIASGSGPGTEFEATTESLAFVEAGLQALKKAQDKD